MESVDKADLTIGLDALKLAVGKGDIVSFKVLSEGEDKTGRVPKHFIKIEVDFY